MDCHFLTFRRDVHLSSSLINNYSVCGPQDRPSILTTATAVAKGRVKRVSMGMELRGVAWSGS